MSHGQRGTGQRALPSHETSDFSGTCASSIRKDGNCQTWASSTIRRTVADIDEELCSASCKTRQFDRARPGGASRPVGRTCVAASTCNGRPNRQERVLALGVINVFTLSAFPGTCWEAWPAFLTVGWVEVARLWWGSQTNPRFNDTLFVAHKKSATEAPPAYRFARPTLHVGEKCRLETDAQAQRRLDGGHLRVDVHRRRATRIFSRG